MIKFFVTTPHKCFHPEKLDSGELAVVQISPSYYRQHRGQLVIRVYDELWSLGAPPGTPDRCWEISKMTSTWALRYLEPGECIQVYKHKYTKSTT